MFTTSVGTPILVSILHRQVYKPLLRKAGLPEIRSHDLRHSSASLLLAQGVPLKVVSELLGHAGLQITADLYGHLAEGITADAAGILGRLLEAENDAPDAKATK